MCCIIKCGHVMSQMAEKAAHTVETTVRELCGTQQFALSNPLDDLII